MPPCSRAGKGSLPWAGVGLTQGLGVAELVRPRRRLSGLVGDLELPFEPLPSLSLSRPMARGLLTTSRTLAEAQLTGKGE